MLNTQPLFGVARAHEAMNVSEKFCCEEDRYLFMFNPVFAPNCLTMEQISFEMSYDISRIIKVPWDTV